MEWVSVTLQQWERWWIELKLNLVGKIGKPNVSPPVRGSKTGLMIRHPSAFCCLVGAAVLSCLFACCRCAFCLLCPPPTQQVRLRGVALRCSSSAHLPRFPSGSRRTLMQTAKNRRACVLRMRVQFSSCVCFLCMLLFVPLQPIPDIA